MDYDDAIHSRVSRGEAQREIERHGADWLEFTIEYGWLETYRGADVLGWLGY